MANNKRSTALVWDRLRQKPCTMQELADDTGLAMSTVHGALKQLRVSVGKRKSRLGAPAKVYSLMVGKELMDEVRRDTEAGLCE